jgi:anaerobic selenocysteine-containing dehydrogenase
MKQGNGKPTDRREFLKTTAAAGAAATAAALLPPAAGAAEQGGEPAGDQPRGYRLTQHVLDYYKAAKA